MFGKKKPLSENEKKAKMAALKGAHGMASDELKGQLKGLKKVEVMSNNKQGLQHGLKKAEELIAGSKMLEDGDDADSRVHSGKEREHYMGDEVESLDDPQYEGEESMEDCSPEEIDQKIAELMKLKEKLESKDSKKSNPFS